jgi:hypothetical protein
MRDCPAFWQWRLDPANRGSFGSLAINDLSGADAQSGFPGRIQAELRPATGASAALDGLSPGTGARPAPCGDGTTGPRLVSRTGRRPAGARSWAQGDLLREHLSLHLCAAQTQQRLPLAPLSAARQEQARPSRQESQSRKLHRRPCFLGKSASRCRRSQDGRSLGGRPDDVLKIRSGHPHRA